MKKEICLFVLTLLSSLQAAAQSSLFIGAGPSVNHISMDVAPAPIPNFDDSHRLSVNAEVLYGFRFPNHWQVLGGAGLLSIKYGVEAGLNIQPQKPSFPEKYFLRKNFQEFSTITPFLLTAGSSYTFIRKPKFEADASLMLDAVYFKSLNMLPLERNVYGTYYLFDQHTYHTGWKFYLQPGIRLKRITRHHISYWLKVKASINTNSVLEVGSSSLQHDNKNYEATIRTSGSVFAILAGVELPLSGRSRERKISDPARYEPKRQLITARVGLSANYPVLKEDSGNMLYDAPHIGGYVGVAIEERIGGPFFIGTGLTNYTLSESYKFSLPSGYRSGGSSGNSLFGVPVSLAWYQTKKRWSARFAGSLGYIFNFITSSANGGSKYSETTIEMETGEQFRYKVNTFIPLGSAIYTDLDISGSYSLSGRIALHSFIGFSYGFKNLFESRITYQYNNQQEHTAKMNFGLNHLNFGLGLRYSVHKN